MRRLSIGSTAIFPDLISDALIDGWLKVASRSIAAKERQSTNRISGNNRRNRRVNQESSLTGWRVTSKWRTCRELLVSTGLPFLLPTASWKAPNNMAAPAPGPTNRSIPLLVPFDDGDANDDLQPHFARPRRQRILAGVARTPRHKQFSAANHQQWTGLGPGLHQSKRVTMASLVAHFTRHDNNYLKLHKLVDKINTHHHYPIGSCTPEERLGLWRPLLGAAVGGRPLSSSSLSTLRVRSKLWRRRQEAVPHNLKPASHPTCLEPPPLPFTSPISEVPIHVRATPLSMEEP